MSVYDLNRILAPKAPKGYADDTHDLHYVPAPCQAACPIGTDAPSYIGYIWEEKYEEAFEAITATNPFSSICGRVCDAPCEPACRRADSDGPIMIRNLKRFVMDEVGHAYDPPAVEVTQTQTIGIVGAGPAGLAAAQDLCQSGYKVDVYEMSDRAGGMMVWGIPAFRLPPGIIQEDIDRLAQRCPGLTIKTNMALGQQVSLDDLRTQHDAVLLTIGAWWGKDMQIDGEKDTRVVDGVGFLRRVNAGERPELPDTVVVIGGGDVAMDACRVAKRLPGCKHVKVVYRRGPDEIPARAIELEGAVKEGIEFIYHTQQIGVTTNGNELGLNCVKTELGDADIDGRRRPVAVKNSEHIIDCGMVIAAVGQQAESAELAGHGMMLSDRIDASFQTMRTSDPKIFAAGDGAFGGSTIVMAMHHGQRAAYYIKAFLEGIENPLPYRTPYKTRRVPVAQDIMWERFPQQEPEFFGLGRNPIEFPEIESTYTLETARAEAARCYRCDAETGSADYSVQHREDIFSMARTVPSDQFKLTAMLDKRLSSREDPFPEKRSATLDDLVFLPANLSRLVIDPYREACRVTSSIAGKLNLNHPFMVTGFDDAPQQVKAAVGAGLRESGAVYLGTKSLDEATPWIEILGMGDKPSGQALGTLYKVKDHFVDAEFENMEATKLVGLIIEDSQVIKPALDFGLKNNFDVVLINATGDMGTLGREIAYPPALDILRDCIAHLREIQKEEFIDLIFYGGIRSGTDAAKIIGLGANTVVFGVATALAAGGQISDANQIKYSGDFTSNDRSEAIQQLIKASVGEASMMARCTGKTNLYNLEPEDLRSISIATAEATGLPLVGSH